MALLENYSDIFKKIINRYSINPISSISGHNTTTSFGGLTGYVFSNSSGTVTIGTTGSYCAILVQKGFNGSNGSYSSTGSGTTVTSQTFTSGSGGGTGTMILSYGWIPSGNYNYSIGSTTIFNGQVASNTGSSTTIDNGYGAASVYSSINGGSGSSYYVASSGTRPTDSGNVGVSSAILSFPAPLNQISIIGGSGASGNNKSTDEAYGGGAGRLNGLGGIIQGSIDGAGSSASTYGGGGGGGAGGYVNLSSITSGGTGGPGCLIIVPYELLNSKIIDNTTLILDSNFKMGGFALTSLLDQGLVPSLNSNQLFTLSISSLNTNFFKVMYPFGSSDTINYLNSRGFKTMPFILSGNSIKYAIVRNTSTNLYYMTLFAENTCSLILSRSLTNVDFICCGNGGEGGAGTTNYGGSGGSGGGVAIGTIASINMTTNIQITRASASNTVLAVGGTNYASAGGGSVYAPGYTVYSTGRQGSSITLNSGFSLASYGFGGSGSSGGYGFGGVSGQGGLLGVNAASGSRSGIGYGAGAGGEASHPIFGGSVVSGRSGVVILSFVI